MIYIVKDIEEDLDFGCEERLDAAPKMAVAVLADETGRELRKKVPDQHLYDEGIEPGSRVYFDENNVVRKALSREHWTEEYSGIDIDVSGFIHDKTDRRENRKNPEERLNWSHLSSDVEYPTWTFFVIRGVKCLEKPGKCPFEKSRPKR